jgi:hypothetical protein
MERKDIVKELVERGYQAEAHDVIKNGVTFEGVMIRGEGAVAPIIYTNEVIKVAEANGASLSEVIDEVIREYKEHKKIQLNIDQFSNKKFILSHMYVGIQKASNEEIEKKMCELEGLESFLFIRDRDENGGSYSAKVNEQMLELINVSVDDAWERAENNTFAETEIQSITSLLFDLGGMSNEETKSDFPELYVISNNCRFRGASAILNRRALKEFAKEHGVDELIVLPSSIHEMMILPYRGDMNLNDLSAIVKEVNAVQVEPEERLTDRAYLIKL